MVLTVLGVMIELASQTSEEVPELSIIVIDTVHRVQETMEAEKIGLPVVAVPAEGGDLQTIADLTIPEETMIHVVAAAVVKTAIKEKAAVMAQDQVLEGETSMKCYNLKFEMHLDSRQKLFFLKSTSKKIFI